MSPTETLLISCGVNLKPPTPAVIVWTFGLGEAVDVGAELDGPTVILANVDGPPAINEEAIPWETVVGKKSWPATIVVASLADHERLIVGHYNRVCKI